MECALIVVVVFLVSARPPRRRGHGLVLSEERLDGGGGWQGRGEAAFFAPDRSILSGEQSGVDGSPSGDIRQLQWCHSRSTCLCPLFEKRA